jgi:uncharacterized protein YndB with AHSA1/START domain
MRNRSVARQALWEVTVNGRIEREILVEASPGEVWEAMTSAGWLADEVCLDLRPGGEAIFRSATETKFGWIEDVALHHRLAFWWAADDEPATRVELTLSLEGESTRVCVVETRPLDVLDLVGVPLPGSGGSSFGPALVAA